MAKSKKPIQKSLFRDSDFTEVKGGTSLAPAFVFDGRLLSKRKRTHRIASEGDAIQENMYTALVAPPAFAYPALYNDLGNFRRILQDSTGPLGCDFEFEEDYWATHIGISYGEEAACVACTPEIVQELVEDLRRKNRAIVGHSVLGAERRVISKMTGIKLGLEFFEDSMISHHILGADLCSAPQKSEDAEEKGSLGFMTLGYMAHFHTDLPVWKFCPGKDCNGVVCPIHNKSNYCAVDAYASVKGHHNMMAEFEKFGVRLDYYRRKHVVSEIALAMEDQGIRVNRRYIKDFDTKNEEKKLDLFPFEMKGKEKVFAHFNPKSPDQVLRYFAEQNIVMETAEKGVIREILEKQAEKHGFAAIEDLETAEDLPEVLDNLYKLFLFKESGKGLKPWFDDKYIDRANLIHPRFVMTGTSTDRWSSSRPNFTNIPSHGPWGSMVKKAIVPRSTNLEIADADASQLELRVCLTLAGMDPKDIPPKVFEMIIEQSKGGFDRASQIMGKSPREVAKTFTHGGNYMESFQLLWPGDLSRKGIKNEIDNGARRVYLKSYGADYDWVFRGQIVTFTGTNIAERIFGDKSYENRKKALEILEDAYMANFPMIRRWQKSVLEQVERDGFVRSPFSGRFLRLYGDQNDQCKAAIAFLGQGVGAEHMQSVIVRRYEEIAEVPLIHVHDAITLEIPKEWSDEKLIKHYETMFEETPHIPNFRVPGKIKRGPTYGDLRPVN